MIQIKLLNFRIVFYLAIYFCFFVSGINYPLDIEYKILALGTPVPPGNPGIYISVCKDKNSYTYNSLLGYVGNNVENYLGSLPGSSFCVVGLVCVVCLYCKNYYYKKDKNQ